jgi:glycosyltransferase 2 family protein
MLQEPPVDRVDVATTGIPPRGRRFSVNRSLSFLMATVLTLTLLAWVLQGVSWPAVGQALGRANWGWLGLGSLAYLVSCSWRALRWGTLLGASGPAGTFLMRLEAIYLSYAGNHVLPAHGGELLRSAYLAQQSARRSATPASAVPVEAAIGSIVAEKLLDVGMVCLMVMSAVQLTDLPREAMVRQLHLDWVMAGVMGLWLVCLVGARWPDRAARLVGKIMGRLGLGQWRPWVEQRVCQLLGGLSALQNLGRSGTAIVQSLLVWGFNALTYWFGLVAFGVTAPGFAGGVLTEGLTALAIALPSAPGYVGPYEAGIRFALAPYNIPIETVIAYILAMRLIMSVMAPLIGGVVALRMGWLWGQKPSAASAADPLD